MNNKVFAYLHKADGVHEQLIFSYFSSIVQCASYIYNHIRSFLASLAFSLLQHYFLHISYIIFLYVANISNSFPFIPSQYMMSNRSAPHSYIRVRTFLTASFITNYTSLITSQQFKHFFYRTSN